MVDAAPDRLPARPGRLWGLLAATALPAVAVTTGVWFFFGEWWGLSLFFWYSIPGNSFLALPHEPAVIYAGALYPPVLVGLVGGVATSIASAIDYIVMRRALTLKPIVAMTQSRFFQMAVSMFNWHPWLAIVVVAFTPIPFYPVRVLAPAANYPVGLYILAVAVGRTPRYILLAMGGAWAQSLAKIYF